MAGVFSSYAQNNGIAKGLGLFVFPNDSQDSTQQNTDEATCYKWAIDQTGYDPMNPPTVVGNTVDTSPDGAAVKGSVGGGQAYCESTGPREWRLCPGQCPWHVLQHICLKYGRLQNLNLSTRGQ